MIDLAALILIAYLPGALVFRAPVGGRDRRAALSAEERAFWAVVSSACWSLAVTLALAGAGAFTLSRLLMVNGATALAMLVVWRDRLLYRGTARRPEWTVAIPIGLIALGASLYFPAAEYVIGGKDPGTYVNEGVQIAQRGSLIIDDLVVSSVPPASRDLFFPWHKSPFYYGLRFMGFFVQDPAAGTVIGQFPHLLPASIAIGYELNGLSGARQTVGVWAILGLVAVYLVGARLAGPVAGGVAAALLAVNVIQVWFSRYPNSETVMQALVFAALLAFARAGEGSQRFFGAIAGILLGLMLFLRYDVVLAIAAFSVAAAVLPVMGQRVGMTFIAALGTSGAIGLWYLANPMMAYAAYPLGFTRDSGGWWLGGAGLVGLMTCHVLLTRDRFAAIARRWLPVALSIVLVGLAAYAYFFRVESGRTAFHDAIAFRTFAWYVNPWVLLAMVAGLGWLTWHRFWRDPAFFLTLSTFGVFFFYKTRIAPEHFWASRRFLAVILPGAVIVLAGATATALERLIARRSAPPELRSTTPWASAVALALVLSPVAGVFWSASTPVRRHVEYGGLIPELERLAGRIGDRDLLLVESRNAGSDLHVMALPLAYIYAKNVLVLQSPVPEKRALENFVAWAETAYANVLFLGGGGTDLLSRRLSVTPIANAAFGVDEYAALLNAYPHGTRRKDFEFGLYRVAGSAPRPNRPIDLEIGGRDDLNVVRFHARERSENGSTFRWSGAQSFVLLLGIPAEAREIVVWMGDGGRPVGAPAPHVEVALGEVVLGTTTAGRDVAPHVFRLPAELAERAAGLDDPVRLRLRVPTWVPADLVGGVDTRDLGVMVTRVEVR
jgi:hypothetical protein